MSGEEIHGNDVEGVLAFKQPWPSMARTVWGAHKRYMDTYLNVYKGYYVSELPRFDRGAVADADANSSPEMVPVETTKVTTGSVAASTMSSTFLGTDCRLQRLRLRSSSTVRGSCSGVKMNLFC